MAARVLIAEDELQAAVSRLGAEISAAYPDGLVAISVLKGSVLFFADLMRAITVPVEVDFLAISSYGEGTGRVRIVKDLDIDIHQRPTLLVEDIVDTGLTLTYILSVLQRRLPASLDVCTLLDKTARRIVPPPVRFVGFTIPDEFVLGYGLDFAERYRNLNRVIAGDLDALQSDPDAHVAEVYGG